MNIYREVRKKMSSDLGYDFNSDTWTDESIELFNETVDTTKIVVEKLNIDSLIAFAKWTTTMQEMFIEDSEAYVDQFIKESNS